MDMRNQGAIAWLTRGTEDPFAAAEGALVARARTGDHWAFGELVGPYKDRILNLARRIVLDADAAEDVTQEVFIRAYRQLHRFDGRARFATWLYRIAINVSRTHLRAQQRRHSREAQHRPPRRETPASEVGDLVGLLGELPLPQRTALALFYLRELSVAEIARLVGAPEGTVKAWLYRGRERLRALARERGLL
jgi:RNA polymerase sigma-70 factor (ECF subfamily)